jgi:hypothetical protein
MGTSKHASVHERWAHLRFSVVGQLLAAPPPQGELRAELRKLAARTWQHPVTGEPVRFALSTIERWLLRARRERPKRRGSCNGFDEIAPSHRVSPKAHDRSVGATTA